MSTFAIRLAGGALVALTALGTLNGCGVGSGDKDPVGGGGNATAPKDKTDTQDAFLKYAQCMRENGIKMDDPKPGGGLLLNGKDIDPQALEAAEKECHHLIENALPDPGKLGVSPEQKESMLAQAKCMRDHGWSMPDPQFDGGRVTQQLGNQMDPSDPAFQEDQATCAKKSGVQAPTREGGPS